MHIGTIHAGNGHSYPDVGSVEPTDCEDGNVRLIGDLLYRGRVEICRGHVWGSVCYESISTNDAEVICRMLGYHNLGERPIS